MALSSGNRKEFSFRTRRASWESLRHRDRPFDVLIAGGGIVGAGFLRELALAGLTDTLLVEKNDFASGTSGASSKLVHAGIRYLEQAWNRLKEGRPGAALRDFRFVVQASAERRTLSRIAPHLVRSKRIHLVLAAGDRRSRLSVLAGTWLYHLIQLAQGQRAPRPRAYFRKSAIRRALPEIDAAQVRAVFTFSDSETDDARLVIENLQSANDHGATALNYVEVASFEPRRDGVAVTLRDAETGETADVRTRVFINASGAFVDDVAARGGKIAALPYLDRIAGAHLDVYPPVTERSYYVTAADGRLVFVLCREEDGLKFSRIGTTERPLAAEESSESPQPSSHELRYLIALARRYFPHAALDDGNIIGTDAGIRPLRAQRTETEAFRKSREHDIVADGPVYHVIGVKLTDYRRVAGELLAAVRWEDHGLRRPSPAAVEPLRPAGIGGHLYAEDTVADVVYYTMAVHWDDLALRRLGARPRYLRRADPPALERLFTEMSQALGWASDQAAAERTRLKPPVLP